MDDGGLGRGFWTKTVGIVVGLGVLSLLVFVLIGRLMYRFGMIGALLVVFGILMLVAYRSDRKKQRDYDKPEACAGYGPEGCRAARLPVVS